MSSHEGAEQEIDDLRAKLSECEKERDKFDDDAERLGARAVEAEFEAERLRSRFEEVAVELERLSKEAFDSAKTGTDEGKHRGLGFARGLDVAVSRLSTLRGSSE